MRRLEIRAQGQPPGFDGARIGVCLEQVGSSSTVTPAEAGVQFRKEKCLQFWIPALAELLQRDDGRPTVEYIPSKSGDRASRTSSTIARIGCNGCPAGTRASQLTYEKSPSLRTSLPRISIPNPVQLGIESRSDGNGKSFSAAC